MKRVILFILALAIVCAVIGHAEQTTKFDFSALTDSELIDAKVLLDREFTQRSIKAGSVMYPGDYVAGQDFEPGRYTINCVECINGRDYGYIATFNTENRLDLYERFEEDYTFSYNFENGSYIRIETGVVVLTKHE